MARIGSVALTTAESDIFKSANASGPDGPGVVALVVRNPSSNVATASVRSASLGHEAGSFWDLAPGESVEFVARRSGIQIVTGKASSACSVNVLVRIG